MHTYGYDVAVKHLMGDPNIDKPVHLMVNAMMVKPWVVYSCGSTISEHLGHFRRFLRVSKNMGRQVKRSTLAAKNGLELQGFQLRIPMNSWPVVDHSQLLNIPRVPRLPLGTMAMASGDLQL